MKVATGRVVEGKVVLEGEPLSEGAIAIRDHAAIISKDQDPPGDL